jgi:aerobic C4-dicarboxylate transport protein
MALILGIDRFMSAARAVVNISGNAVAAVAMSNLEGELDRDRMRRVLNGSPVEERAHDSEPSGPAAVSLRGCGGQLRNASQTSL